MRRILLLLCLIFSISASSQVWQVYSQYGLDTKAVSAARTFLFPTGCGNPSLYGTSDAAMKKAGLYLDSCAHKLWFYDPKLIAWDTISASGGNQRFGVSGEDNLMAMNRSVNMGGNEFRFNDGTANNYNAQLIGNDGYIEYFIRNTAGTKSVLEASSAGDWNVSTTGPISGNAFFNLNSSTTPRHDIIAGSNMYGVDFNWKMQNTGVASTSYFRWNRGTEHTDNTILADDDKLSLRSKTNIQGTARGIFIDSVGQFGLDAPTSSGSTAHKILLRNPTDSLVYASNYSLSDLLFKSDSLSGGYTSWLLTKKKIDSLGALIGGGQRFGVSGEDATPAENRSVNFTSTYSFLANHTTSSTLVADSSGSSTGVAQMAVSRFTNNAFIGTYYRVTSAAAAFRSEWNSGNIYSEITNVPLASQALASYFRTYNDSLVIRLGNSAVLKGWNITSGVGTKSIRYDPSTGLITYADTTSGGGAGVTDGDKGDITVSSSGATWTFDYKRNMIYAVSVATDANITAAAGTAYSLPAATLSTDRTIDMTNLNTNGDYIEIDNQEAGFTWTFTGQTVYDAYENAVTVLFAQTRYIIRRTNGKLKIIN